MGYRVTLPLRARRLNSDPSKLNSPNIIARTPNRHRSSPGISPSAHSSILSRGSWGPKLKYALHYGIEAGWQTNSRCSDIICNRYGPLIVVTVKHDAWASSSSCSTPAFWYAVIAISSHCTASMRSSGQQSLCDADQIHIPGIFTSIPCMSNIFTV